ncbi:MAG: hypothetical protein BWX77_00996 [Bacteroidetes bacterium ADurb.Bin090]|nr:MAG: hypothetical protein BWX77_00996 [Bacteroidetes bacterium ADurb.Bin090]
MKMLHFYGSGSIFFYFGVLLLQPELLFYHIHHSLHLINWNHFIQGQSQKFLRSKTQHFFYGGSYVA